MGKDVREVAAGAAPKRRGRPPGRKNGPSGASGRAEAGAGDGAVKGRGRPRPVLDVPKWGRLVKLAEAALDEQGEERYEKWRRAAERRMRLMAEKGLEETADLDRLHLALCTYYAGLVTPGGMRGFKKVFADVGASLGEFFGGVKERYAELRLVYDYLCRLLSEMTEAEARESAAVAQESQMRLLTEEDCRLNQRAVEVSLKATMRKVYGDSTEAGGGVRNDRAAITYSFPNMTLNWIVAPGQPGGAAVGVGGGGRAAVGVRPAIDAEVSEEAGDGA